MANKFTETDELQVKLTLQSSDGTATTTRTIAVPNPNEFDATQQQRMNDLRTAFMTGSLSSVIQPANWRDDGENADPYTTVDVEFTRVTTSKTTYDLNQ